MEKIKGHGQNKVKAVLVAVLKLYKTNGWMRGDWSRFIGRRRHFCLHGAVREVAFGELRSETRDFLSTHGLTIEWNDKLDKRHGKRTVVRALRRLVTEMA